MFPRKLRLVRGRPGQTTQISDDGGDKGIALLLRAIVTQAMRDGMHRVAIGVDPDSREPWMKYYGPCYWSEPKRTWWDMVPPPAAVFPRLFRCAMAMTHPGEAFPPEGTILAASGWRSFPLVVRFPAIHSLEIEWPLKETEAICPKQGRPPEPAAAKDEV